MIIITQIVGVVLSWKINTSLKIPNGQLEAVNGRTDIYNGPKKKDKITTMTHKTLHRKPKIEQHEPPHKTNYLYRFLMMINKNKTITNNFTISSTLYLSFTY
jgi:hypothetical protein